MAFIKKQWMVFAILAMIMLFHLMGKIQNPEGASRQPSAAYGNTHYPAGVNPAQKEKLWHISEGADVIPLRWFLHIKSLHSETNNTPGEYLYQNLEDKFGVIELDPTSQYENLQWKSPMKWAGLTLAWSEPGLDLNNSNDITYSGEKPKTDEQTYQALLEVDSRGIVDLEGSPFGGQKKIPMVGTNCTFCHSGKLRFSNGQEAFIEGAPNMLNVRNFFSDMLKSTIKTMINRDRELDKYLVELKEKNLINMSRGQITAQAQNLSRDFKRELKGMVSGLGGLDWAGVTNAWNLLWGNIDTKELLRRVVATPENQAVMEKYFARFLALSYGVSEESINNTPVLQKRMKWMSFILHSAASKKLLVTPEGYGRTDAFGRISNAVARGDNWLPLVAPVSFPPMWGMEYSSLFHYNSNTNSVIMRNIGQSFGLGALVLDDQATSTANIANLNQLEKLIYKIPYPEWNEVAPPEYRIAANDPDIVKGCEVYANNCMGCHDSRRRVGPTGQLIKNFVHRLDKIGTDSNYAKIQATPVLNDGQEVPFRFALFGLTKKIKDRYVELLGQTNAELQGPNAQSTLDDWGNFSVRGKEHFRDTYLGEDFGEGNARELSILADQFGIGPSEIAQLDYMRIPAGTHGYVSKSLAGVWATAPYLHNGSVPTIEALITPIEQGARPNQFLVGCRGYDHEKLGYVSTRDEFTSHGCAFYQDFHLFDVHHTPDSPVYLNGEQRIDFGNGNSNLGHSGQGQIIADPEERRALLTFLKVLRPPPESSWRSRSPYTMTRAEEGERWTCSLNSSSVH